MPNARVTRSEFLEDRQGIKFADVVNDREQPFDIVLAFFSDPDRQRRMEESELHHDRAPLAGVVRELESQPEIDRFLTGVHVRRSTRLRQAIGVLVRIIMERRGWKKTGKKGSLGVRAAPAEGMPAHNSGGLAFWFVRRAIRTGGRNAVPLGPGSLPRIRVKAATAIWKRAPCQNKRDLAMNLFHWFASCFSGRGKAMYLYRRGMAKAKKHDHQGAIDDYTATIGMSGIPADMMAMVLYNRAIVHVAAGDEHKGTADLDAVLAMEEAVVNVKTMARQKLARMETRANKSNA